MALVVVCRRTTVALCTRHRVTERLGRQHAADIVARGKLRAPGLDVELEMVEVSQQEEWSPYKMENRYSIWQRRFILRKKDGLISIK